MSAHRAVRRRVEPVSNPPVAWIDRWLAACHDLAELERTHPMTDAVIDEIDGRMIRIGDRSHRSGSQPLRRPGDARRRRDSR